MIETKPTSVIKEEIIIIPSKTEIISEKKALEPSKKIISSVVEVQSSPANTISSKLEIKSSPLTKINVIEGKASSANNIHPPLISSKVEVVEGTSNKPTITPNIITKVEVVSAGPSELVQIEPIVSSRVEVVTSSKEMSSVVSSIIVDGKPDDESPPVAIIGNNIGEPEYDFLSRQPSEVVEETYKVINLKPSSKFHLKPRPSAEIKNKAAATKRADSSHPTGLVTKLGGTVVKDGTTTVHETSVIGTYISGKYAQVLQSTSHIYNQPKGKINPSPTLRILKTAAPTLSKGNKHNRHLEPTPAGSISDEVSLPVEALFNSQNSIKSTRKPTGPGTGYKQRFKNKPKEADVDDVVNEQQDSQQTNYKKTYKSRSQQSPRNSK